MARSLDVTVTYDGRGVPIETSLLRPANEDASDERENQSLTAIASALGCVYRISILGSLWPLMAATSGMLRPFSKNRLTAS